MEMIGAKLVSWEYLFVHITAVSDREIFFA